MGFGRCGGGEGGGVGVGAGGGPRVGAGVGVESGPELPAGGFDQVGTEPGDKLAAFGEQRVGLGPQPGGVESWRRWLAGDQGRQQLGLGGGEPVSRRDGVPGHGEAPGLRTAWRMAASSAARSASLG
jgi:hypothetical protein